MKKFISLLLISLFILGIAPVESFAANSSVAVLSSSSQVASFETSSDLTDALKKAFSYCDKNASVSNRLTISVPEGRYIITKSVQLSSFTTLDLTGSTLLLKNDTSNMFRTPKNNPGYSGCDGFALKGGTLGYSNDVGTESCLIRIAHAANISFDGVTIRSSYLSHLLEIAASSNVTVTNCEFDGVNVNSCREDAVALQIDILEQNHFPGYEPYDGTANNGITVTNCNFKNLPCGVGTHSLFAGFYQSNITISGNSFYNISGEAVSCMGFIITAVSNNVIENCGAGIHYYMMKADAVLDKTNTNGTGSINNNCASSISNNTISVVPTSRYPVCSAIYVFGNDVTNKNAGFMKGDYCVKNINVSSNKISTNGFGIRMSDVKNSCIESNTVYVSSADYPAIGVYDSSDDNRLISNTLEGGKTGIALYSLSSGNSINTNTINKSAVQGILLTEGTADNSVTANTITSSGAQGIYARGNCSYITGNTVSDSGHIGIYIKDAKHVTAVDSNNVYSSKESGIYVDSGCNVGSICSNTVSNSRKFGIKVLGKIGRIAGNTIKNSKKYGLCIEKSAKANVYRNTFSKNKSGSAISAGKKSIKFSNLAAPKSLQVKKSGKKAVLKWKKVKGASKYIVYRSTGKKGKYTKIATVSKTSFSDKKTKRRKTYYYKVTAVKDINKSKLYSNPSAAKKIKM